MAEAGAAGTARAHVELVDSMSDHGSVIVHGGAGDAGFAGAGASDAGSDAASDVRSVASVRSDAHQHQAGGHAHPPTENGDTRVHAGAHAPRRPRRGSGSSRVSRDSGQGAASPVPAGTAAPSPAEPTIKEPDANEPPVDVEQPADAESVPRPHSAPHPSGAPSEKKSAARTGATSPSPFARRGNPSPSRLRPTSSSMAAAARRSLPKERPVWGVRAIDSTAQVTMVRLPGAPPSPPQQRLSTPPAAGPRRAAKSPVRTSTASAPPTTRQRQQPSLPRQPSASAQSGPHSLQPPVPIVTARDGFANTWCRACGAKQDLSSLLVLVQSEMKAAESLLLLRNEEARGQHEENLEAARSDFENQVEATKRQFSDDLSVHKAEHDRQASARQNEHVKEIQRLLAEHHASEERYNQQLMAQAHEHEYVVQQRDAELAAQSAEIERLNKRIEQLTYVVGQVGKLQLQGYNQLSTALEGADAAGGAGSAQSSTVSSPIQSRMNGSTAVPPRMSRVDSYVNGPSSSRPGLSSSSSSSRASRVNTSSPGAKEHVREGSPVEPSPSSSSRASPAPRESPRSAVSRSSVPNSPSKPSSSSRKKSAPAKSPAPLDLPTDDDLAPLSASEQLDLLITISNSTNDPNVRKIIQPRIGRIIASMPDEALIDQLRLDR
eukprot:TRINITY_DN1636_c0_g1_i1.p1 TRINITY_DN1636_c0_g1~~TRINITY_DN1636_c0_g1_i1.p1  ORF type:complete len:662 (-),score=156.45 TRINITY_DN1636_c0_g1_i1:415-2400(-)